MQANWGIDVGLGTFIDLCYADDEALLTAHSGNWDEVLTNYKAAANTLSLCTNWQKTKVPVSYTHLTLPTNREV